MREPLEALPTTPVAWLVVGVGPGRSRVYFNGPDSVDTDNRLAGRSASRWMCANEMKPPVPALWAVDMIRWRRGGLASDPSYSVEGFTILPDGRWVGYTGSPRSATSAISRAGDQRGPYLNGDRHRGRWRRLTNKKRWVRGGDLLAGQVAGRLSGAGRSPPLHMDNRRIYLRRWRTGGGNSAKLR